MTFDEILLILRDNDVQFEFVESLYDGCHVFHIYLEDEEDTNEDGFKIKVTSSTSRSNNNPIYVDDSVVPKINLDNQ